MPATIASLPDLVHRTNARASSAFSLDDRARVAISSPGTCLRRGTAMPHGRGASGEFVACSEAKRHVGARDERDAASTPSTHSRALRPETPQGSAWRDRHGFQTLGY